MAASFVTGHLLLAIPFPEPISAIQGLRTRYPNLKITYIESKASAVWHDDSGLSEDLWKDVTMLCTLTNLPDSLQIAPKLEFIYLISAGADHVSRHPIYTSTQISMFTSNGIHGPTIGEWVALVLLVGSRRYEMLRRWQVERTWNTPERRVVFSEVEDNVGKRFGILGYGSIGRQAARYAQTMGMEVVVCTSEARDTRESRRDYGYVVPGTGDPEGIIPSRWYCGASSNNKEALRRFLSDDLDYLLISVPLTPITKDLIGREEIEILAKRNAFILNIARGEVVDQQAIIDALREYDTGGGKGLRGYGTDVAIPEPLPEDHALWTAPNCIITPHLCGVHRNYAERALGLLEVNIERHVKGKRLINLIDRETGYASKHE